MTRVGPEGWFRRDGDRLVLELHVQPGAGRTAIAGLHGKRLKIRLAARAVDGAANACLVEFLAEALGVAKRNVVIETGETSRAKRVSVRGARGGPEALWRSEQGNPGSAVTPC
ncbi:MAG: YggU family protein [Betaproteobacteria bacterium]|nr:YggU family protein [Betaproteobacteria bacterium]